MLIFFFLEVDMDDPADIWTIDGSLNTLSDRPGMDSQETDSFGIKLLNILIILIYKASQVLPKLM